MILVNMINTTTQEALSQCQVVSSFSNSSEQYVSTVSPSTVQDFKDLGNMTNLLDIKMAHLGGCIYLS